MTDQRRQPETPTPERDATMAAPPEDATIQTTPTAQTAADMASSGEGGGGAGLAASSAAVVGPAESAVGAVSATGRRLRLRYPGTPGGSRSPQKPGASPDFSTIPEERVARSPKVAVVRRPESQEGTAEEIMGMFDLEPGEDDGPERWELGPTSFEEQRKVDPTLDTPDRPQDGYAVLVAPAYEAPEIEEGASPLPLAAVVDRAERA